MDIEGSFKLFDIRGDYPAQVNERFAFVLGKALALSRQPKKVVIAYDTRKSSPALKEYLIDGLGNIEIFDSGIIPVTQFYYTMATSDFDLGVMITASHIADTENGFKLVEKSGLPFDQAEILKVKAEMEKVKDVPIVVPKTDVVLIDVSKEYQEEIYAKVAAYKFTSRVVLDVSHSAVEKPVTELFTKLGINFTLVKEGTMGSPLVAENQRALAEKVRSQNADLGIKWDSDGDRVVFLDETGRLIPPTFVLGILGADAGGKIAIDVRAGLVIKDLVKDFVILPAWGQYIKFAVQKDPTITFGGEISGHYIYRDFYCIDDGILAALKFLTCYQKEKIHELSKKYFELPEKNFTCENAAAPAILEALSNFYRNKDFLVSVEDGLTVFGEDFKFNLRESLTEPFLRLNLETKSQKRAEEIIYELEKHILV